MTVLTHLDGQCLTFTVHLPTHQLICSFQSPVRGFRQAGNPHFTIEKSRHRAGGGGQEGGRVCILLLVRLLASVASSPRPGLTSLDHCTFKSTVLRNVPLLHLLLWGIIEMIFPEQT